VSRTLEMSTGPISSTERILAPGHHMVQARCTHRPSVVGLSPLEGADIGVRRRLKNHTHPS
jgi:hypothetical protein